jgi:hypothetical protein
LTFDRIPKPCFPTLVCSHLEVDELTAALSTIRTAVKNILADRLLYYYIYDNN